jgi:hypothetical protein
MGMEMEMMESWSLGDGTVGRDEDGRTVYFKSCPQSTNPPIHKSTQSTKSTRFNMSSIYKAQ